MFWIFPQTLPLLSCHHNSCYNTYHLCFESFLKHCRYSLAITNPLIILTTCVLNLSSNTAGTLLPSQSLLKYLPLVFWIFPQTLLVLSCHHKSSYNNYHLCFESFLKHCRYSLAITNPLIIPTTCVLNLSSNTAGTLLPSQILLKYLPLVFWIFPQTLPLLSCHHKSS